MKKGLIFLNGDSPRDELLKSIDYADKYIVCADGAYDYLKKFAKPNILLGDFDSVKEVPSDIKTKRFPVDKDFTDGHLAVLEAHDAGVTEVEIYGAFGGRPDHEYANFALLALCHSLGMNGVIRGAYDIYFSADRLKAKVQKNMTVSIVPYSDTAHIISSKGLKFCASGLTLNKVHLIGMSNTAIADEIEVEVGSGSVLIFVQRS